MGPERRQRLRPAGQLMIDTITPSVTSITENSSSGHFGPGATITFTVNLSEAVTVAGGSPSLNLNDGGTATYTSGSGTSSLVFTYTVGPAGSGETMRVARPRIASVVWATTVRVRVGE
jgi:large repetitive protein